MGAWAPGCGSGERIDEPRLECSELFVERGDALAQSFERLLHEVELVLHFVQLLIDPLKGWSTSFHRWSLPMRLPAAATSTVLIGASLASGGSAISSFGAVAACSGATTGLDRSPTPPARGQVPAHGLPRSHGPSKPSANENGLMPG